MRLPVQKICCQKELEVKVSFGLPTCMEGMMYPVPFASPEQMIELAQHAEKLGYHSVWGNDHMTTQRYVRSEFEQPPRFWELLVTLSFAAAETTKIGIATGVLVPAMRTDIVVLAKQLSTLDHFSGGRLLVGLGVGAYREEFEALQPKRTVHRGKLLEESVQALQLLFSERVSSWAGTYYEFENVEMFPKPLQQPLPIYIGGNNVNAVRRAALYGQGWMGAGMPANQLGKSVKLLRETAQEAGRDPGEIDIAPQFAACIGRSFEEAEKFFQGSQMYKHLVSLSGTTLKDQVAAGANFTEISLIGSADQILEKIDRLRQAGATHISGLLFPANTVQELKDQMQQFAEAIIPRVKDW
jgi:probable F420-dependent oxidoreductase